MFSLKDLSTYPLTVLKSYGNLNFNMLQTQLNNLIITIKCLAKMSRFNFVRANGMQGGGDCCGGGCAGNC